jgi:hypothetical protein
LPVTFMRYDVIGFWNGKRSISLLICTTAQRPSS